MIKSGKCKHPAQDKRHGKGRRVHNESTKLKTYKCTVCSAVRS